MLTHQGYIIEGGSGSAETGGGFDEFCTGLGHDLTHFDLFFIGEQTGLNDHFQDLAAAGFMDLTDLFFQLGIVTSWEIDGETVESVRLYFWGLKNHCRWWLQP